MHQMLETKSPKVIGVRVSGKLSKDDYDAVLPLLRARVDEYGNVRWLIVMDDFHGWDALDALAEDLRIDAEFNRNMERIAMVGDKTWEKLGVMVSAPLFHAEMKFFGMDRMAEAQAWVHENL